MFCPRLFVRLFVRLSARVLKRLWTDFDDFLRVGVAQETVD